MAVNPLSDVVIIRRADPKQVSDGGVYLPPSADFTEDIGTVVYAGLGRPHKCQSCHKSGRIPMQVRVGEKVIFSTNGHQLLKWGGEELIVLKQDSIIAVIEDEAEVSSARGLQAVQEFYVEGGYRRKSA